ncbi:MAG: NUMOD4 motif-containing HNH endonuclease [Nocardioidaceae bacterium]
MSVEQWAPVPEDPRYEVSDQGRVRSWAVRGNSGARADRPALLKPGASHGYRFVRLGGGPRTCRSIHRLVLIAFVGEAPEGCVACHNNGDRADNRLSNLRWDTPEANCADEVEHGTSNRGEANCTAKLSETDVYAIRASSERTGLLATRYGVTTGTIRHIKRRHTWGWLPELEGAH